MSIPFDLTSLRKRGLKQKVKSQAMPPVKVGYPTVKMPSVTSKRRFSFAQIPSGTRTTNKSRSGVLSFHNLIPNTKYKVFHGNRDITRLCLVRGKTVISAYGKYDYSIFMKTYRRNFGSYQRPWRNEYLVTDDNGNLHFQMYYGSWVSYSRNKKTYNRNIVNRVIDESDVSLVPSSVATKNLTTTNRTVRIGSTTVPVPVLISQPIVTPPGRPKPSRPKNPFDNIRRSRGCFFGNTPIVTKPVDIKQEISYDLVQSFYLDSNSFGGAKTVDIAQVSLYFKETPGLVSVGNSSRRVDPTVTVCLIDIDPGGIPITQRQYNGSIVKKKSSQCSTSNDASVDTDFAFDKPVRLRTGKFYGIGIVLGHNNFELWSCKTRDRIVGTNKPSPGASRGHRGELFLDVTPNPNQSVINRMKLQKARDNLDLKFDVFAAEYDVETQEIPMVFKDYEFLSISNSTEDPAGGEYFFKQTANSAGTITVEAGEDKVIGVGTDFTTLNRGDMIVITDGTVDGTDVVEVGQIESSTVMYLEDASPIDLTGANYKHTPVGELTNFDAITDKMVLDDSTAANSTFCFEDGDTIIGADSGVELTISSVDTWPLSVFNIDFDIDATGKSIARGKYNFAYYDGSAWQMSNTSTYEETLIMDAANHIDTYENNGERYNPSILSRSLEVKNSTNLYDEDDDGVGEKSAVVTLVYGNSGGADKSYETPELRVDGTNIQTHYWQITTDLESEHTNNGTSDSKHISKQLVLGEDKSAEDIVVVYNAYRPPGSDLHVYAKVINSDDPKAFLDKSWTKLEMTAGANTFSSPSQRGDWKEYTFGFPAYPPSESTLTGTVDTSSGANTVTGTGTSFTTALSTGDVVKIYSEIFPDNYGVFQVTGITNNTTLQLNEAVSNVNIQDTGLKMDKIETPYTAFNNADNLNIVRYFTPEGKYDTYNTVAIKTILTSNNANIVPSVNDYRVIAVSA